MTSNILWAGSDQSHKFVATYYTDRLTTKEWPLYDRPGNDYFQNKGDLWEFSTDTTDCIHPSDVISLSYRAASKDGWNIETAFTIVSLDDGRYALLTADVDAYRWIDTDKTDQREFTLNRFAAEPHCRWARDECVDKLYVFALTSGNFTSGSDSHNVFGLRVTSDKRKEVKLYDRTGDDFLENKADLWVLDAKQFARRRRCLKFGTIRDVALTARSANSFLVSDKWQVQSAFVIGQLKSGRFALLSADANVHQFVDESQTHGVNELRLPLQNC